MTRPDAAGDPEMHAGGDQAKFGHLRNPQIGATRCAPNHIKTCAARHIVPQSIQKHMVLGTHAKGAKRGLNNNAPNVTHTAISGATRARTTTWHHRRRQKKHSTTTKANPRNIKKVIISLGVSSSLKSEKNRDFLTDAFVDENSKSCCGEDPVRVS